MGFKRTADGRVFFETPEQDSAAETGGGSMQVTGLLKALNERLKEAQLERGKLIRDLDEVRASLSDMAQRTERAERAYIDLEQQISGQQNEAFKKAERAERAAKETLGDMLDARNSLSDLRERTQTREHELETIQSQLNNAAKLIEDVRKRQAIVEKFQREHGEKMVDHVAAYVTLSKRVSETQTGYEALDNKIGEVSGRQDNLDRKFEKSNEDRVRMMRKIDRIEETVMQMRDTLNAKAMVVLADPSAAAFQQTQMQAQAKVQQKAWQPQNYQEIAKPQQQAAPQAVKQDEILSREPVLLKTRADEDGFAWWQKSSVQTVAIAIVLCAGVLAGWAVTQMKDPQGFELFNKLKVSAAAPAAGGPTADQWQPIQSEEIQQSENTSAGNTAAANDPSAAAAQIVSNWTSPSTEEISQTEPAADETSAVTPAATEQDTSDDIGMVDINDQEKLAAALDTNPDAVAAQMNAIEPGDNEAEAPAPAPQQIASLPPAQATAAQAPVPATPTKKETAAAPAEKPSAAKTELKTQAAEAGAKPTATGKPVTDITPDTTLPTQVREIEAQALAGVPEAQHDLAAIYIAGHAGVSKNYDRAALWFRKAADNGIANARYNLGVLYQQGLGVPRSLEDALKWYTAAAQQGHPEAQYNLGIAYIEGIGVPYDPFKAADYFEFAANHGVNEAAYNLGLIYENGLLGKAQPQEALKWYKTAADGGSPEAKAALEQLAKNLGMRVEDVNRVAAGQPVAKTPAKTATADQAPKTAPAAAPIAPATQREPVVEGAMTADVQAYLMRFGLYPGPADGVGGPLTSDAIRSYQAMNGLKPDGEISQALLTNMKKKSGDL